MNKSDRNIVKAINLFLSEDSSGAPDTDIGDEQSHILQFEHEYVNDIFHKKVEDSAFRDSLNQAFSHVHNYKYITDPMFAGAMESELSAQGIPRKEIVMAVNALWDTIKEMGMEDGKMCEKDVNWSPDLKNIMNRE